MKESIIQQRTFDFSLLIINLYKDLCDTKKEYIMSKQLLRSGTAIGAMIAESKHAESKMDFIHKTAVAQKEANETLYWIKLLYQSGYIDDEIYAKITQPLIEIQKILSAIIMSSKNSL